MLVWPADADRAADQPERRGLRTPPVPEAKNSAPDNGGRQQRERSVGLAFLVEGGRSETRSLKAPDQSGAHDTPPNVPHFTPPFGELIAGVIG